MDARPIGIFDSGMGGVSLLRDARMLYRLKISYTTGTTLTLPTATEQRKRFLP